MSCQRFLWVEKMPNAAYRPLLQAPGAHGAALFFYGLSNTAAAGQWTRRGPGGTASDVQDTKGQGTASAHPRQSTRTSRQVSPPLAT